METPKAVPRVPEKEATRHTTMSDIKICGNPKCKQCKRELRKLWTKPLKQDLWPLVICFGIPLTVVAVLIYLKTQTMRKQETRGAYLQRRSAQLRRKRWEGTMTEQEGIELDSVQHEILLRHVNRIHS